MIDPIAMAAELKSSMDNFVLEIQKKEEEKTYAKILLIEDFTYEYIGLVGKFIVYREEQFQAYTVAFIFKSNKMDKSIKVSAKIKDCDLLNSDKTFVEQIRDKIRRAIMVHLTNNVEFSLDTGVSHGLKTLSSFQA